MTSYNTVPFNYDDDGKKDEAQQGPSTAPGESENVQALFFNVVSFESSWSVESLEGSLKVYSLTREYFD